MNKRAIVGCLCGLPFALTMLFSSPVVWAQDNTPQEEVQVAVQQNNAMDFPVVTLQHWKNASQDARYAFLIGFVTAIEMEKQWQGKTPLPLEKSLNNTWAKGFGNVTLKNINDNINLYVVENPDNLDLSLVEYLWYAYAQPQVNEKVSKKKLKSLNYKPEVRPLKNIKPALKGGN